MNTYCYTKITVFLEPRRRRTIGELGFLPKRAGRLAGLVRFLEGFGFTGRFLTRFLALVSRAFFWFAFIFRTTRLCALVVRWSDHPPRRIDFLQMIHIRRVLLYAFFLAFRATAVWFRHRVMSRVSSSPSSSIRSSCTPCSRLLTLIPKYRLKFEI